MLKIKSGYVPNITNALAPRLKGPSRQGRYRLLTKSVVAVKTLLQDSTPDAIVPPAQVGYCAIPSCKEIKINGHPAEYNNNATHTVNNDSIYCTIQYRWDATQGRCRWVIHYVNKGAQANDGGNCAYSGSPAAIFPRSDSNNCIILPQSGILISENPGCPDFQTINLTPVQPTIVFADQEIAAEAVA